MSPFIMVTLSLCWSRPLRGSDKAVGGAVKRSEALRYNVSALTKEGRVSRCAVLSFISERM